MSTLVLDLSHYQSINPSLVPAKAAGVAGIIHKCTEGPDIIDKKALARYDLARQAGLLWGLYHFLRPGNYEKQITWFYANARSMVDENTIICIDHEDRGVPLADLKRVMELTRQKFNRNTVVLYSGFLIKEQLTRPDPEINKYPLWVSHFSTAPKLPPGWSDYFLWQYTDKGNVPGITLTVDLNMYKSDVAALTHDWGLYSAPIGGVIPPVEPPVSNVITIQVPKGLDVQIKIETV